LHKVLNTYGNTIMELKDTGMQILSSSGQYLNLVLPLNHSNFVHLKIAINLKQLKFRSKFPLKAKSDSDLNVNVRAAL